MELKKNPKADLEKKKSMFLQIGLVVSLGLAFVALEWRTYEREVSNLGTLDIDLTEEEIIPITQSEPPPPPPPPPQTIEIQVVEDDVEVDDVEIQDTEADQTTFIEIAQKEERIEEVEIFTIVEDMPSFPGGEAAMMKWLNNETKYPPMAKEAGIQGIVFVSFVIGPDGKIKDAQVVRGVNRALDEEAMRVINKMPSWTPGKQRGKAVSVQFTLPIRFTLR